MRRERCDRCGAPLDGSADCPECRHPEVGEARRAPEGSDAATPASTDPQAGIARGWDAVVFGTIVLLTVVAVAAWLV